MAHILVVEDDPVVRDLIEEICETEGHQVSSAENGKNGIRLFYQHRFDVAIVDLFMPEKDGLDTIQEISALSPTTRIVAISGGGRLGTDVLGAAQRLGASAVVLKPFRVEDLLRAVQP